VTPEEALEEIEKVLDEIRDLSQSGVPIIVEGEKDAKALRKLNVKGDIHKISEDKRTALNFLEKLSTYKRVMILTDFDRAGNELARFCAKHLESLNTEAIVEPRDKLKALVRKFVKDIEGLPKFVRTVHASQRPVTRR